MAWDFETDAEYQKKLDWVDEFVREEVKPLDLCFPHQQLSRSRGSGARRSTHSRKRCGARASGPPTSDRTWVARASGSSNWRC